MQWGLSSPTGVGWYRLENAGNGKVRMAGWLWGS